MARFVLILIFILPGNLFAGKHLFIINQKDPTFIADACLWRHFFNKHLPSITITSLVDYSSGEVRGIFENYVASSTRHDTIILVITGHTVKNGNCTLLKLSESDINVFDDLVLKSDYEQFLTCLDEKQARVLVIINSCDPFTVINPIFIMTLKNTTVIYSDEKYSINQLGTGSLIGQLVNCINLPDMASYINWLNDRYENKEYYYGYDKTIGEPIMNYFPQRSTMYGPNYILQ